MQVVFQKKILVKHFIKESSTFCIFGIQQMVLNYDNISYLQMGTKIIKTTMNKWQEYITYFSDGINELAFWFV